jgi:hypothetical protein
MNVMIAGVGMDPSFKGAVGGAGIAWIEALAVVGLILMLGALRSARRAPVYVVRDIGRRF